MSDDREAWIEETVRMVHEQGYRVIPIMENGVPRKYADGQTYTHISDYRNAKAIGVVLDEAVLLDYDGNKADEKGEQIMDLQTLAHTLGLEEMPECVQEGSKGRSLHWVFTRGDQHTSKSSCDGWLDHIDVKTGNQLLHLKFGKVITDNELPHKSELQPCPEPLLESLMGRRRNGEGGDSSEQDLSQAQQDLNAGNNIHASALVITNHLIFEGKTPDEIRNHFMAYGQAIAQRGSERSERFWNGELDDIIESGMGKYESRVIAGVEGDFQVIGGGTPNAKNQVGFLKVNWNDFVFMAGPGLWRQLSTGAEFKPPNFNTAFQQANTWIQTPQGRPKRMRPTDFMQDVVKVPQIYAAMYDPSQGEIFNYNGVDVVNTYMPRTVPEVDEFWALDGAVGVIERHFLDWFDDEKYGRMVIQWMAHNVQHPGKKILWAPIICGVNGDGKSSIKNILAAVMGGPNVGDISIAEIHSQFNSYAEGKCVRAIEEIRIRGTNRHEVMNALKPLITNESIVLIKKGRDGIEVPNVTNYIAFTNYPDALALEVGDRRWVPLYTKFESHAEMLLERTDDYWHAFHHAYRERAGSLRGWLLNVSLEGFDPNFPPDTGWHKHRMVSESRSDSEKIVLECLDELGEIFTWPEIKAVGDSLGAYGWNSTRIGSILKSMGYDKTKRKKIRGTNNHYWCKADLKVELEADNERFTLAVLKHLEDSEAAEIEEVQNQPWPNN